MRDIRDDLRERLKDVDRRRAVLDDEERGIKALLASEDKRFADSNHSPRASHLMSAVDDNGFGKTPLSRLILNALKSYHEPVGLDDFKQFALSSGFNFGEQSPGRTLHWALVGLTENGHLECSGSGPNRKYRLKEVTQ